MSDFLTNWSTEDDLRVLADIDEKVINWSVARRNVQILRNILELMMRRYESSKNFHFVMRFNTWKNHPDEHEVPEGKFNELCHQYLNDIVLTDFLRVTCCQCYEALAGFSVALTANYNNISYDAVECACLRMQKLFDSL